MIKTRSLPLESTVGGFTIKSTLGLALLIAVISACSDKPDASSKALAIINGKEITTSEFDLRWSQIPDYARKTFAGPTGRRKFLEELINHELLLQEAKNRGFDRDRAFLERVERFKERSILERLRIEEVDVLVKVTMEEIRPTMPPTPRLSPRPASSVRATSSSRRRKKRSTSRNASRRGRTSRRWPGRSHWIF